jgi:uncharacterized membrane protein
MGEASHQHLPVPTAGRICRELGSIGLLAWPLGWMSEAVFRVLPALAILTVFLNRRLRFSLDEDVDVGVFFQFHLIALSVVQRIVDADLFVQVICLVHGDLSLLGHARQDWLSDLLDRSALLGFGFRFHSFHTLCV